MKKKNFPDTMIIFDNDHYVLCIARVFFFFSCGGRHVFVSLASLLKIINTQNSAGNINSQTVSTPSYSIQYVSSPETLEYYRHFLTLKQPYLYSLPYSLVMPLPHSDIHKVLHTTYFHYIYIASTKHQPLHYLFPQPIHSLKKIIKIARSVFTKSFRAESYSQSRIDPPKS